MATQSGTQSFVDTKITLIKKSGPGVLIGLVEQVSKNGYVDFSGLQFELPGEYVISVISDSNTIENTEITITVLPQDDIIPQDDKATTEQKPIEGTRPIIAQIDKPSVKLSPIEFDGTDQKHDNEVAVGLGFTPFFWYNGYQVSDRDISSLNLYYDGILPKVSIIFIDSVGFMKKDGFPLDDAKFELFLNSGSKNLKSIHLKFKLENFQENKGKSYTIIGTLDLKDFYKIAFKSYRGTSFEVLRKISGELELGFNSNITNTVDSMNWVNNGKLSKDFFLNIINHSYISDTSYVLGYIDFYYCFNYVDIEKEWLRDISNDVGLNSTGINHLNNESDKDKIEQLILTNDKSMNTSPFYFSGYKLNNNSTQISLTKGYFTRSKVYDSISKQFLIFDVNSQTSDGSKTHILKGATNDTKDIIENYRTNYSGKMDTENVYKNYYYSETQNKVNLDNLVRISVDITLPNPNFNLYKFMKIQLVFVNPMSSPSNDEVVQSRLTGEWLIVDIGYVWTKGKLTQTLNLVRKEIGKTTEEIESDRNKSTGNPEVNTENNENPTINSDVTGYTQSIVNPENEGVFVFSDEVDTEISSEYTEGEFIGNPETTLTIEEMQFFEPTEIDSMTKDEIYEIKQSYIKNRGKKLKSPPNSLIIAMRKYGITSKLERAHFLAQCSHESSDFQYIQELGGPKWWSRYQGRKDLGNINPGDGIKYHGRGYIQLTGRVHYKSYSKYLLSKGVLDDVLLNPDLVATKYAADSACYWWKFINTVVSKRANSGSSYSIVESVSKAVNGGTRGLSDRVSRFNGYYAEIQNDYSKYA
jgi:putative chitinase